jgi:ABC-type multidrug transport system ATPase subunit
LGLHKNLKVGEQLRLYAKISGMSNSAIAAKLRDFDHRFRLPPLDSLISVSSSTSHAHKWSALATIIYFRSYVQNLSFGQQKLVSVSAALVSSPTIAVLDEPTVGLDPYRRSMIWDYFATLASQGHTIFVTTHHVRFLAFLSIILYCTTQFTTIRQVNEAYRANLVAIMFGGQLAIQGPPNEVCYHSIATEILSY